jgi:hypothetical protein
MAQMGRWIARSADGEVAEHGTTLDGSHTYVDSNDRSGHTNAVEDAFSFFKPGITGVYQHCGEQHLTATLLSSSSGTIPAEPTALTSVAARAKRCGVSFASV